jgi:hypothetical protein
MELVFQQRIYITRISFQYSRPVQPGKPIRKLLHSPPVFNPQKDIRPAQGCGRLNAGNSVINQMAAVLQPEIKN